MNMRKIVEEMLRGVGPTDTSPEAEKFRKDVEKDIEYAKEHGLSFEIPSDMPGGKDADSNQN